MKYLIFFLESYFIYSLIISVDGWRPSQQPPPIVPKNNKELKRGRRRRRRKHRVDNTIKNTIKKDPLLLIPGPLTTSRTVKESMLHDYGPRDSFFIDLTKSVREKILQVLGDDDDVVVSSASRNHHKQGNNQNRTVVLLQGSGTFAIEAMVTQFVPSHNGEILILANGIYGRRMAEICKTTGRKYTLIESKETEPISVEFVQKQLTIHKNVTHVGFVHCETTTGVLQHSQSSSSSSSLQCISQAVAASGKGFLIDAISSFGIVNIPSEIQFHALVASSNKGLQGSPGLSFVICDTPSLEESRGNSHSVVLDLYSQWKEFEEHGEWRFTPPTHCLLALHQALEELELEGGVHGRRMRYEENCKVLVHGMRELGFETLLDEHYQSPVLVTFKLPKVLSFDDFHQRLLSKGYFIYPGGLTKNEATFRVGCIGDIVPADLVLFVRTCKEILKDMDVTLN